MGAVAWVRSGTGRGGRHERGAVLLRFTHCTAPVPPAANSSPPSWSPHGCRRARQRGRVVAVEALLLTATSPLPCCCGGNVAPLLLLRVLCHQQRCAFAAVRMGRATASPSLVTSPWFGQADSLPGMACVRRREQRGPPCCCCGRGGVSNAARPAVVPAASGRAALLLPRARNNNVVRLMLPRPAPPANRPEPPSTSQQLPGRAGPGSGSGAWCRLPHRRHVHQGSPGGGPSRTERSSQWGRPHRNRLTESREKPPDSLHELRKLP